MWKSSGSFSYCPATISRFPTLLYPSEIQSVVACRTGPKGCLAAAQGFHHGIVQRLKDKAAALAWAKENALALVAVETVERLDADGFRDAAERIRAAPQGSETPTEELLRAAANRQGD